jgi:hypothetical protein
MEIGEKFTFELFASDDPAICSSIVRFGKRLFEAIVELCSF